jgi:hypothetical protein
MATASLCLAGEGTEKHDWTKKLSTTTDRLAKERMKGDFFETDDGLGCDRRRVNVRLYTTQRWIDAVFGIRITRVERETRWGGRWWWVMDVGHVEKVVGKGVVIVVEQTTWMSVSYEQVAYGWKG